MRVAPFYPGLPVEGKGEGCPVWGRVRVRVRVRVSQGCGRFAKGDGRRGTKLGPGVPKLGPLGPMGILSTATLACHGGAPIQWNLGPKLPNSRVFGKGKGAGKGAGK